MPKLKNILITYPRLRKGEKLLFWILDKIMDCEVHVVCFSPNVHKYNIARSVEHSSRFVIKLFFVYYYGSFFLASQDKVQNSCRLPEILLFCSVQLFCA